MDSVEIERRIQLLMETSGFRLINAHWKPMRGRQLLRVIADAENHNITVTECAELSRSITDLLDSYPHEFPDYTLEVSSPGLNHPLKVWQLGKNIGRTVEVRYKEEGRNTKIQGELVETGMDHFTIVEKGKTNRFHLDAIEGIWVQPSLR